jgi:hypothetical protein
MKRILALYILLSVSSLLCSHRSFAQISWQLTDSGTTQGTKYLTSLSCAGSQCTATGYVYSLSPPYKTALFFMRSTDGGLTWKKQESPLEQIVGDYRILLQVQQFDSLNAIAVGDTAIILRTSDAGATWVQQECPVKARLTQVHFSDPNTGIIVGVRPPVVLTTHDGGDHWIPHLVDNNYLLDSNFIPSSCHSFGGNSFASFAYGSGPILSTTDDWATVKTTSLLPFEISGTEDAYVFVNCFFVSPDTAIAYGNRLYVSDSVVVKQRAALVMTTNGGVTWNTPIEDTSIRTLTFMSQFDNRLFATSSRTGNKILVSTDRGFSWKVDSLILPAVPISAVNAIYATTKNSYVGFFAQFLDSGPYLGLGHSSLSKVETYERIFYGTHYNPNPASTYLHIHSVETGCDCQISDVLGRIVLLAHLDDHGDAILDLTSCPCGYYLPVLKVHGANVLLRPIIVIKE